MKLRSIINENVDDYLLANFLGSSDLEFHAKFYLVMRENHPDLDSSDYYSVIMNFGGDDLILSTPFIHWLCSIIEGEKELENYKLKVESTLGKIDKDSLTKRDLIWLMEIFEEYREALSSKAKAKRELSIEDVVPYTGISPNDFEKDDEKVYLSLHYYQQQAKRELIGNFIHHGVRKQLLQLPTGSGKTKTAVEVITDLLRVEYKNPGQSKNIFWFSHSAELCEQSLEAFKDSWRFRGDTSLRVVKLFGGTKKELLDDLLDSNGQTNVIYASFQQVRSLLNSKDKEKKSSILRIIDDTFLTVVDEAHMSLAKTYKEILEIISSRSSSKLLGLTATPGRNNTLSGDYSNISLAGIYDGNIVSCRNSVGAILEEPIKYLQDSGFLAQIDHRVLDIQSRVVRGKETESLLKDGKRNYRIVMEILELDQQGLKTLVFAGSVAHAKSLKIFLSSMGVDSEFITGELESTRRKEIINDFKNGSLNTLINFGVLATGFDAPKLNAVFIARPVTSLVLYSQLLGRALRGEKNGGNDRNILITVRENIENYPDPDFIYKYWDESWFN